MRTGRGGTRFKHQSRQVDALTGYYRPQIMREEDRIREHIERLSTRDEAETATLVRRISRACWPGGLGDRMEPSASRWLQRWRPARAAAPVPSCSCAVGHCAVCN